MLFDRDSGTERPGAGRGIKDYGHHVTMRASINRLANFAHHGDVEDVQWRARKSNARHAILDLKFDVGELAH
jgi:hypothetical protein